MGTVSRERNCPHSDTHSQRQRITAPNDASPVNENPEELPVKFKRIVSIFVRNCLRI